MAVALSVLVVWTGILLACITNRPPTFWITSLFFAVYLAVEGWCRAVRRE
jgi:hypothetical protein